MTKNPFRCGEPVAGDDFTGRYRERELLQSALFSGRKVLLTAPRFYGRSSLARRVMSEFERQGVITVYIDFERAFSLMRFIEQYLAELLRSAFRQPKDLQSFIESLPAEYHKLPALKITATGELQVDLKHTPDPQAAGALVLELAHLTSEFRKRPCVVCFDEASESGCAPEELRNRLRETARARNSVGYLVVDEEPGKSKDREGFVHLPLGLIEERYLRAFIKTRFENTGYRVDENVLNDIMKLSGAHAHYAQMLCRELWNLGVNGKVITSKQVMHAADALLETQAGFYISRWLELSPHQKSLLLAICQSGGKKIFSQAFVSRHGLGGFSTVQKSLGRLAAMRVLERCDQCYHVQDPFFRQWILRRMI